MTRSSKPLPGNGTANTKPPPSLGTGTAPPPNTNSLNELHNQKSRALLDVVNQLQSCGLDKLIPLPQLLMCGDQSSGKSSTLEGLTEVPFPCHEGLCTRFVTRFENRLDPHESIRTKIIPDDRLSATEKKRLSGFDETITDFEQFGSLIEHATKFMGLKKGDKVGNKRGPLAFSRNSLNIEISGPERLPISIVDFPGLIHTETAEQTEEDKILIHDLYRQSLMMDNSIVLAVVSATTDLASNEILSMCRKVDPDGQRTLGIITKMDCLPAGCKREKIWLDTAQNHNIKLGLGWHLLKNRSDEEHDSAFEERNISEEKFFNSGSYKAIPCANKGIGSLRTRISDLLYEASKDKLPDIRDEANVKLSKVNAGLKALGDKRATVSEQRSLLMSIAIDYNNIVSNAVEGHYEHSFFKDGKQDSGPFRGKFLRGATENLQNQFTKQMLKYGHKYHIPQTQESAGTETLGQDLALDKVYEKAKSYQTEKSRAKAVAWVEELHTTTRGRELPGNFNSTLVTHLFHEQSENWEKLAEEHIINVEEGCTLLVTQAVRHIAPPEIANNIIERLDSVLSRRYGNANRELAKLLVDRTDPVAIYDPSFAMDVQQLLDHQHHTRLDEANRRALLPEQYAYTAPVLPVVKKQHSNQMSAEKALNHLIALYSSKVKTFSANVTQQVIERNLLKGLADDTLSAAIVHEMSHEEISDLAAEPGHVTRERERLASQKDILEKSRKAFNKVLNPRQLDNDEDSGNTSGAKRTRRRAVG